MRRKSVARWFAAALLLASAAPASVPLPRDRGETRTVVITIPQFVVRAVSFKAVDETGSTDWGSDEVHAVFVDFNPVREAISPIYGDVDTNNTIKFGPDGACIAPQPKCDKGANSLHFAVALWESDWSLTEWITGCYPTVLGRHPLYDDGICPGDDLIGRVELAFSQMALLAMLPEVGGSVERQVKPTGGDGSYRLNYRITRMPNLRKTVVIGPGRPPQQPAIMLQAALDNPPAARRINLTWSGASAASVDILRGAALVATTPNDGQETDRVPASGTYQYRVCNAGTTMCSNTVSVTVP